VLASAPQESGARVRVVRLRVLMVAMVAALDHHRQNV
jgi:hypothetical protein